MGSPGGGEGPPGLPSPPAALETDIEAAARLAPLAGFLTGRDCPWFTLPYHHDLLRYELLVSTLPPLSQIKNPQMVK